MGENGQAIERERSLEIFRSPGYHLQCGPASAEAKREGCECGLE